MTSFYSIIYNYLRQQHSIPAKLAVTQKLKLLDNIPVNDMV